MSRHVYTPTEINREVRTHIEAGFPQLWVEGEISNLARPASGHLYFTLKDQRAQLRCALFRSSAMKLAFKLENGQQVQVRGRLGLYEGRGEFQMVADRVEAAGEGQLRAAFEALKKKLETEGLFDPQLRQALPPYPQRIAVITSGSGAVIRDIVHVLARRWPLARVRLYPCAVQGENAPGQLMQALQAMNQHAWAEVAIIGRGGGSLEDLWAFNDEGLARAVHASPTPIVSAVGHETDYSICDFVADLRAPTPSAAAELVVPDQKELKLAFQAALSRLASSTQSLLQRQAQRLDEMATRVNSQHPRRRLAEHQRVLQALERRHCKAMLRVIHERQLAVTLNGQRVRTQATRYWPLARNNLELWKSRLLSAGRHIPKTRQDSLAALARTLQAVSPLTTLDRGYAIVSDAQTGTVVLSPTQVKPGDRLKTRLSAGDIYSRVESCQPEEKGEVE